MVEAELNDGPRETYSVAKFPDESRPTVRAEKRKTTLRQNLIVVKTFNRRREKLQS